MLQVELNNVCINIGANNGSENYEQKNTANSGKLIKAVCASYVYFCIFCKFVQVG